MNRQQLEAEMDKRGMLSVARDAQIAWIAAWGMSRLSFALHVGLSVVLAPIAFWIGYVSNFGDALKSVTAQENIVTLFFLQLFQIFYWMCLAFPVAILFALCIYTVCGMFSRSFWDEVRALKHT